MNLSNIIKEITKFQQIIPEFVNTKNELDHKCYKLLVQSIGVIKLCLRGYFLDDTTLSTLQTDYYTIFIKMYNIDIELFQMLSDYNSIFLQNLIKLLEEEEYYEAASNISKLINHTEIE